DEKTAQPETEAGEVNADEPRRNRNEREEERRRGKLRYPLSGQHAVDRRGREKSPGNDAAGARDHVGVAREERGNDDDDASRLVRQPRQALAGVLDRPGK